MAAETFQQIGAGAQGPVNAKAPGSPHRSPQLAAPLPRQQGHRPAATLHQAGGDDADDAVMPVALGQQQETWPLRSVRLQQGQGFGLNGIAKFTPLAIQGLAAHGEIHGAIRVFGGQQINHQQGIPQAAHRIDAGSQLEGHRLGIQGLVAQSRQLLQRLQAGQGRGGQPGQAIQQPTAVDPRQGGHVSDGADTKQI